MKGNRKDNYPDGFVDVGDVIEILEAFEDMVGFRYGIVLKNHLKVAPPSTHLRRTIVDVLAPDGTIKSVPFNFIDRVIKNDK